MNKKESVAKLVLQLTPQVVNGLSTEKLNLIRDRLVNIDVDCTDVDGYNELLQYLQSLNDNTVLTSFVEDDEITAQISYDFDIDFKGLSTFKVKEKYIHPTEFGIGLIVGTSGGGKTTLLKEYGEILECVYDNNKSISSNFDSYDQAKTAFFGVGLNSIPVWLKPYSVLSNGEKYRATMAKMLKDGAVFDEFTSIVDRPTAMSMASSIGEYIRRENFKGVVFASPHKDIIEWLQPDWVYNVDTNEITLKENLRSRPKIELKFKDGEKHLWGLFSKHHYISETLNKSCRFYTVYWDDILVGMSAVLTLPSGTIKNAFRGHRTVVLPEYQGFGFGKAIANAIGQLYIDNNKRFYAKTAHPKLGLHRQNSSIWKPTSKNRVKRKAQEATQKGRNWVVILNKPAYSHEFIGEYPITYLKDFKL